MSELPLVLAFVLGLLLGLVLRGAARPQRDGRQQRLEGKLDLLLKQQGLQYDPMADAPAALPGLLRQGKTLEAIKLYREAHGCGLKEAKDAIDAMKHSLEH